jgi:acetyl esterase
MPVDPQIQTLLDKATGVPATHTLPVNVARAQYEARIAVMAPPADIAGVREQTIDGPGGPLRLRMYTPHGAGPFPLLVFFHGSGFVLCSLDTHDGMCRNLCAGAGCVVASVDYRLAPEHKLPAGLGDCLHATRWAALRAVELGADPTRIAVGGDSAGGNMAAVTAIRVRDEGGPALCGQLLLYPVTDYHTPGTPSYEEDAEGYGLTRDTMKWFWAHYLNDESQSAHPHASPLRAPDLSGLPPALVITAEYDPLRDEGELYAARLRTTGVRPCCRAMTVSITASCSGSASSTKPESR